MVEERKLRVVAVREIHRQQVHLVGAFVEGVVEALIFYFVICICLDIGLAVGMGEIFFAKVYQSLELHIAYHRNDHLVGGIVLVEEARQLLGGEMLYVLFAS